MVLLALHNAERSRRRPPALQGPTGPLNARVVGSAVADNPAEGDQARHLTPTAARRRSTNAATRCSSICIALIVKLLLMTFPDAGDAPLPPKELPGMNRPPYHRLASSRIEIGRAHV